MCFLKGHLDSFCLFLQRVLNCICIINWKLLWEIFTGPDTFSTLAVPGVEYTVHQSLPFVVFYFACRHLPCLSLQHPWVATTSQCPPPVSSAAAPSIVFPLVVTAGNLSPSVLHPPELSLLPSRLFSLCPPPPPSSIAMNEPVCFPHHSPLLSLLQATSLHLLHLPHTNAMVYTYLFSLFIYL